MSTVHEHAASLNSALLRAMVMTAVDGIIAIDPHGVMRMVNPAAERLFGYTAAEMLGRNITMLMPEPYCSEHGDYLQRYLDTGLRRIIGIGREVQGRRKNGSVFPMYLSVADVRHEGEILFAGIVHDLSERHAAEEHIRLLQHQHQLILDTVGQGILGIGAEGLVTFANPAACALLGCDADRLVGRGLGDIWQAGPGGDPFPPQALVDGAPYRSAEVLFRREDGSHFPVELISRPMRDGARALGAVLGFQDITERKRASQEMQRMRSYLKSIIDSMPSVLVGVDVRGCITEWNAGAESATGVAAADAMGRSFVELLPHLGSQMEKLEEALRTRRFVRTERLPAEDDGEIRYFDVIVYPLVSDGASGAVIRVDDITNRVRIEQMMVQTEKMMSVGGLAAGMAHEINNPLSGILQGCQNVQRRLSPGLAANRADAEALGLDLQQLQRYLEARGITGFIEGMRMAALRATSIVSDTLAFSRRSTGDFAPEHLEELLDAVLRLADSDYDLKKRYDFRRVEVVRDYAGDLGTTVCNRMEIEQVFLNIIKNAAQALCASGTDPGRIRLRTRREADYARVDIEDNGPGIDAKVRARVFEPFFTTKPPGEGTGLGLSVSYFIITERHHGSIAVESVPGGGTCFSIRLPLASGEPR